LFRITSPRLTRHIHPQTRQRRARRPYRDIHHRPTHERAEFIHHSARARDEKRDDDVRWATPSSRVSLKSTATAARRRRDDRGVATIVTNDVDDDIARARHRRDAIA